MRKVAVVIAALVLLAGAGLAYAHMWGPGGAWMMGPGYGWMMGPGYYGPEGQKFLKETRQLRQQLWQKQFELREALAEGDQDRAGKLYEEITTLQEKLYEKTPFRGRFRGGYYAGGWHCW